MAGTDDRDGAESVITMYRSERSRCRGIPSAWFMPINVRLGTLLRAVARAEASDHFGERSLRMERRTVISRVPFWQVGRTLPLILSASVWMMSGCAFSDQRLTLKYTPPGQAVPLGVTDRVLLTRIDFEGAMQHKGNALIIGNVRNDWGVKTADAITEDKVDNWILGALTEELKRKGFTVRRVETFPAECDRGARVVVRRLWVEQVPGFWTIGAITDLSLLLELYSGGDLIKSVIVNAKGDSRTNIAAAVLEDLHARLFLSAQKEESLEKALRAAMEQASGEISSTLGQ